MAASREQIVDLIAQLERLGGVATPTPRSDHLEVMGAIAKLTAVIDGHSRDLTNHMSRSNERHADLRERLDDLSRKVEDRLGKLEGDVSELKVATARLEESASKAPAYTNTQPGFWSPSKRYPTLWQTLLNDNRFIAGVAVSVWFFSSFDDFLRLDSVRLFIRMFAIKQSAAESLAEVS